MSYVLILFGFLVIRYYKVGKGSMLGGLILWGFNFVFYLIIFK